MAVQPLKQWTQPLWPQLSFCSSGHSLCGLSSAFAAVDTALWSTAQVEIFLEEHGDLSYLTQCVHVGSYIHTINRPT